MDCSRLNSLTVPQDVFRLHPVENVENCGKPESEISRFVENETPRVLVLWKTRIPKFVENENSCFVENENSRILVLWKTRIGEISFCRKRESDISRFLENANLRISRFVENENSRIPVLWKIRMRQFSFCRQRESENFLFAESQNARIVLSCKSRIREFSFRGKRESPFFFVSGKSRFVENGN